ncbi:hypothetical protein ACE6H2_005892 [Prunus campanulata]
MSSPLIRMLPSPRFITIRTFVNAKPSPGLPPHVNLTPQTLSLHKVESIIHTSMSNKYSAIERHAKLLMLAGVTKLPMHLINRLKWDLGPHDIVGNLVDDFSDYSGAFEVEDVVTGKVEIGFGVLVVGERSLLSLNWKEGQ